ncbi:hypothetical protein TNCV_4746561 [Trichonephila clavipes]|nr:hypothetical protein TNCV_4746561 [Trichonephila clavipes]
MTFISPGGYEKWFCGSRLIRSPDEEIRLNKSDCEKSEESVDVIDNIPVNLDIKNLVAKILIYGTEGTAFYSFIIDPDRTKKPQPSRSSRGAIYPPQMQPSRQTHDAMHKPSHTMKQHTSRHARMTHLTSHRTQK